MEILLPNGKQKEIGPSEFLQPESMDVDSLDNIYVAEYSRKNIQKFDS